MGVDAYSRDRDRDGGNVFYRHFAGLHRYLASRIGVLYIQLYNEGFFTFACDVCVCVFVLGAEA